jgi:membrane-associated phospholipid phosphatase
VLIVSEKIAITPLIFALLVAIIVGVVRWLLGAHTIGQILLGYLTGIFTQLGAYYYQQ